MSEIGKSLPYLSTQNEESFQNMLSQSILFSIIKEKRKSREVSAGGGGGGGKRKIAWVNVKKPAIRHRNLRKYRNCS